MFIELRTTETRLSLLSSPTTAAQTLRNDRRAGALLPQRRRGAEAAAVQRGRLAARAPVTAVRSGGRLVVVSDRQAEAA
jgi:hypothetical protein